MRKTIMVCILFLSISLDAQEIPRTIDTLAGPLPSRVGNNALHLVTSDIIVPIGETITIDNGTIFLFKNFTGLQVVGTVLVKGNKRKPVVFTSENDTVYTKRTGKTAAPYDWNGITISESSSGSSFHHCAIRYSLYGINSLNDYVTVDSCYTFQNGKSDLVIRGSSIASVNGILFYNAQSHRTLFSNNPAQSRAFVFRTGGIILSAVGLVAGTLEAYQYYNAKKEFQKVDDSSDPSNLLNPTIVKDWDIAKKRTDFHRGGLFISTGVFLVGVTGIIVSYTF